ncbi:MAG: phosphoribosylformylglycinamidine synthase I, partial [Candidatus Omnitrophica bacterium]|nr:phosphoribosylformylglycinamidine synthase I [Candidatus Omnitrophota bacterium]
MKKTVKTIILRTAGTNCDKETAYAFQRAGSKVDLIHVNALKKNKRVLEEYHVIAIPGGFTYGDDVASGRILANELRSSLKRQIERFVSQGKLVVGICNGFQVLVKMGLLPNTGGAKSGNIEATLSLNDSGQFYDRWVYLKRDGGSEGKRQVCVWTRNIPEVINIPIAHAEGKFIPRNGKVLDALKKNGQIVFRYSDKKGALTGYPDNPNGSVDNIAGICDPSGRILGMMPHPERHITYLQHPNWRRTDIDDHMGIG